MSEREYAVLPPDRNVVTGMEKTTLVDAMSFYNNTELTGWKLVRAGNYPCGTDEYGTTLFPVFSVLKVKR